MISTVKSCGIFGSDAYIADVETDTANGLPSFDIVGLPDAAVKESKERVRAAIKNCGFDLPSRKYTVNLAPADTKKEGPSFDLPIAISLLRSTGQLKAETEGYIFLGELSLSGEIRPVRGVLPAVAGAKDKGFKRFVVPEQNAYEASLAGDIEVFGAKTLFDVVEHLKGEVTLTPTVTDIDSLFKEKGIYDVDFAEVKGQETVKRVLEIAAAGGHNCLIIGPPGSGKSMLAQRLPTILPDLTVQEALEVTKIHSIAGTLDSENPLVTVRPFRSPHHSISTVGLVGGGSMARPGELSLAHNGVLFLDELPEFRRDATEVMRQPIENGVVTITRAAASCTYPCNTMLVAAMNPCRCGYFGDSSGRCKCSARSISTYLSRISGPLLDRIDLQIEAANPTYNELHSAPAESSAQIRERVVAARKIQLERYKELGIFCNASLSGKYIEQFCILTDEAKEIIKHAFESIGLSARAYSRLLKVARTIADLEGCDKIESLHIAEAIQYRSLDKKFWGYGM